MYLGQLPNASVTVTLIRLASMDAIRPPTRSRRLVRKSTPRSPTSESRRKRVANGSASKSVASISIRFASGQAINPGAHARMSRTESHPRRRPPETGGTVAEKIAASAAHEWANDRRRRFNNGEALGGRLASMPGTPRAFRIEHGYLTPRGQSLSRASAQIPAAFQSGPARRGCWDKAQTHGPLGACAV